ncbi:hypothetical protein M405DRAFT_924092 [Rhizopogon salebrosus TDB-379]|nr:hypothetical protein M405DRAFT_924092 [Rhizopogon salebrosus TDB-379]
MAYISFLFVWALIGTIDLESHALYHPSWCNRSDWLAANQFLLVTVLGTKNNIVSFITGIGYDKLNYVHRMMSRVVFILLWVHAASEIVRNAPILYAFSLRPIHAHAYEIFFYVHFVKVLTFLVCAYFHTRHDANRMVLTASRQTRTLVLPMFHNLGVGSPNPRPSTSGVQLRLRVKYTMNATAELLSDDFAVNPFITLCNVRKGFTARFKEVALKGDKVRAFVDGPYGRSPSLVSYDTSVLIAVAMALDEVLDDGGRGALARDLLDDRALIEKEGPESGYWMNCDFEKIVWVVVVLQLGKISIWYGVEEGWNCWTTPSALWQTGWGIDEWNVEALTLLIEYANYGEPKLGEADIDSQTSGVRASRQIASCTIDGDATRRGLAQWAQ